MERPLAALLVVSLLAACSASSPGTPPADAAVVLAADVARDTEPTRDDVAAAAAAETTVGLALYGHLADQAGDGDVVLSPHSVVTALGMLLAGARGTTQDEIAA